MANISSGLRKMRKDNQLPEGEEFTFQITEVRETESGWEIARCRIVDPGDYQGRTEGMLLLNAAEENFGGLMDLMAALQWEELPEDEETGEQDTKVVLKGVKFKGTVRYRKGRANIRPVIDYNWVNELDSGEEEEENRGSKKGSKKKGSSRGSGTRRGSRRR